MLNLIYRVVMVWTVFNVSYPFFIGVFLLLDIPAIVKRQDAHVLDHATTWLLFPAVISTRAIIDYGMTHKYRLESE